MCIQSEPTPKSLSNIWMSSIMGGGPQMKHRNLETSSLDKALPTSSFCILRPGVNIQTMYLQPCTPALPIPVSHSLMLTSHINMHMYVHTHTHTQTLWPLSIAALPLPQSHSNGKLALRGVTNSRLTCHIRVVATFLFGHKVLCTNVRAVSADLVNLLLHNAKHLSVILPMHDAYVVVNPP